MTNVNSALPAADEEIESRLITVERAVNDLVDTGFVVEDIENELDILTEDDADPEAVGAIHSHVITLLDAQERLNSAFKTAMELARALKDQREQARGALDELKEAVRNADQNVPEVEDLYTTIEEMIAEEQMYYFDDVSWEVVQESIADSSPLSHAEVSHLLALLNSGDIEERHYLWDELRDWMRRADEFVRTGITPPIGVDSD
jgi:hypothetical protein